ncbi:MAG: hypothetical protein ACI8VJ_000759 [Polaribacter sp.]
MFFVNLEGIVVYSKKYHKTLFLLSNTLLYL